MKWFPIIAGAVVMALILVPTHEWIVYRIEAVQTKALNAQAAFDIKKCEADKQITKDTANETQNSLDALANEYDAYRVQHPSSCIVPTTRPASSVNTKSKPGGNVGTYGLSTDWLRDFGNEGNTYQIQVKEWQAFYANVLKANRQ